MGFAAKMQSDDTYEKGERKQPFWGRVHQKPHQLESEGGNRGSNRKDRDSSDFLLCLWVDLWLGVDNREHGYWFEFYCSTYRSGARQSFRGVQLRRRIAYKARRHMCVNSCPRVERYFARTRYVVAHVEHAVAGSHRCSVRATLDSARDRIVRKVTSRLRSQHDELCEAVRRGATPFTAVYVGAQTAARS